MLLSLSAAAQWNLGINTSNWSGIGSMYLNPANLADNHADFCIDITSVNVGVDNNLGTINLSNALNKFGNGNNTNINTVFNFSNNNQFSLLAPYADIHGPGIMFNSKHKFFFAITTRLRGINQFNNFSQSLYRVINDTSTATKGDVNLNSPAFNWTAQLWTETAVSFGMDVYNKGKHKVKVGTTLKFLGGVGYISVKGNGLDAHYKGNSDSFYASNVNLNYASSFINTQNAVTNGFFTNNPLNNFISAKTGEGFGFDLGMVYEYSPDTTKSRYDMDGKTGLIDYSKNTYKLRLSASVTDVGHMTYPASLNANAVVTGSGDITGSQLLSNVKNYTSFKNYVMTRGFYVDTTTHDTKVYLPAALILGADYNIYRNYYVNLTDVTNLANISNYGNTYYNTIAITPRWDTRKFSIAIPVSYSTLSDHMKLGIGLRAGGFFIGSDDMLGYFSNNQYGMNVYFGGFVPINSRIPKDRDHDHVSDKNDKCPDLPGLPELKGCPEYDRDHDGIPDSVDNCPDLPGTQSANGCPDRDGDGIEDDMDRCPNVKGPAALQGCPDRDNDGVADIDDDCPDVPGEALLKGCPDSDGDGVPDNKDQCPYVAGSAAMNGCPDSDGDGIADNVDKCPHEAGPASNHGCPLPAVQAPERQKMNDMVLQVVNDKTDFSTEDYISINRMIIILQEYKDYSLNILSYTDNKGKQDANLKASQKRADRLKKYIILKGIDPARISAMGMGDSNPVGDNTTAEGRARNKRVVLKLVKN